MRVVWFAAGSLAGVYLTAKARRAVEALTVEGVHDRLTGLFAGVRVLHGEMMAGIAEKETELRDRVVSVSGSAIGPGRGDAAAIGPGPNPDALAATVAGPVDRSSRHRASEGEAYRPQRQHREHTEHRQHKQHRGRDEG